MPTCILFRVPTMLMLKMQTRCGLSRTWPVMQSLVDNFDLSSLYRDQHYCDSWLHTHMFGYRVWNCCSHGTYSFVLSATMSNILPMSVIHWMFFIWACIPSRKFSAQCPANKPAAPRPPQFLYKCHGLVPVACSIPQQWWEVARWRVLCWPAGAWCWWCMATASQARSHSKR